MRSLCQKAVTVRQLALMTSMVTWAFTASAQSPQPPAAQISLPPLAWSSWNSFSNTINSNVTVQQANALVTSGLQKSGYMFVNIDEGWWMGDRDSDGNILVDPKMWPAIAPGEHDGDMANIARYVHSLGLKAGIYTDAGRDGCSMFPDLGPAYFGEGSEGHYDQDFLQFAKWGFDYVKVDWCGGNKEDLSAAVQYGEIARAIARAEQVTGRRLYYSICNWGKESPWAWGPGVGGSQQAIWRTGGDIVAPIVANSLNSGRKASFEKMLLNFDGGIHPAAQHTGYYNDPDMMVLGMPGLDAEQSRLHMSLWAISGAPLIIGADVARADGETLATLSNPDAIAIDQDRLGLQCVKVKELSLGLEIWSKFLSRPGSRAVLLLNRTYFPAPMSLDWAELGLDGESAAIRDVWAGKDMGIVKGQFKVTVPAHDGLLLIIRGSEGGFAHYKPAVAEDSGEKAPSDSETVFHSVAQIHSPFAQVRVDYINPSRNTQVIDLHVNAETVTRVAFPPTGTGTASVWLQAKLDRPGKRNTLSFAASPQSALTIESIDVH